MVGPPRMRADGTQTSSKDVTRSGRGGGGMTPEDGAQVTFRMEMVGVNGEGWWCRVYESGVVLCFGHSANTLLCVSLLNHSTDVHHSDTH